MTSMMNLLLDVVCDIHLTASVYQTTTTTYKETVHIYLSIKTSIVYNGQTEKLDMLRILSSSVIVSTHSFLTVLC